MAYPPRTISAWHPAPKTNGQLPDSISGKDEADFPFFSLLSQLLSGPARLLYDRSKAVHTDTLWQAYPRPGFCRRRFFCVQGQAIQGLSNPCRCPQPVQYPGAGKNVADFLFWDLGPLPRQLPICRPSSSGILLGRTVLARVTRYFPALPYPSIGPAYIRHTGRNLFHAIIPSWKDGRPSPFPKSCFFCGYPDPIFKRGSIFGAPPAVSVPLSSIFFPRPAERSFFPVPWYPSGSAISRKPRILGCR